MALLSPEPESYLLLPMASISSMKTIEGDKSSATRNNSLTEKVGEEKKWNNVKGTWGR